MPIVVFSMCARGKLEQRLAPRLADGSLALGDRMNEIERQLRLVFPDATAVVVQDLYSGFRVRDAEQILLAEVANSGPLDGLSVVKLGSPSRLLREWKAWESCRPHGLKHDIVLMDLQRVPTAGDAISALVYADAQQLIGVDETLTLEAAALDAVRLGVPTVESVAGVLFQIFERLGLLLYRHSSEPDFVADSLFPPVGLDRHLLANLVEWEARGRDPYKVRVEASATTHEQCRRDFRDPATFFRQVLRMPPPSAAVPRMLRGRSHGDLHGRNVLVGRVGDGVLWPAVYDFADMGRANWVGLDFAKMEVELKIRAYRHAFPAVNAAYVVPFEVRLAKATEAGRNTGVWEPLPPSPTPEQRLHWLLLQVRKAAAAHLGARGRGRLWLAEYYFLLALYGLNAARFVNLSTPEMRGAYLAAGAAAARYLPVR